MSKYPADLVAKGIPATKTLSEWTQIHSLDFNDYSGFPANTHNGTPMTEANFITYAKACSLTERIAG